MFTYIFSSLNIKSAFCISLYGLGCGTLQVVTLLDVVASSAGVLLVLELLCCNLSTLIHNPDRPLEEAMIKCCMLMLLRGLSHCHSLGILHRVLDASAKLLLL